MAKLRIIMHTQNLAKQKKKLNLGLIYLIVILLGIGSGLSDLAVLQNIGIFISDVFIRIFKCISLPIIALSIIVTLSQDSAGTKMKPIWQKTIFYTISTTIVAACVACALYMLIAPTNIATPNLNMPPIPETSQSGYLGYLTNLIPTNIFSPFLEQQVMTVLLVSIVVGIAIHYIPDDNSRSTITNFFKGAHGIFFAVIGWVVKIIPIALYGFITATVVQLKSGMDIKGLGGYLLVIVLANLIQGFIVLPLFLASNKIKPFKTMRAMLPALSVAFFSKSSTGALPVAIDVAEKNLGVTPKVSRFVLPLCTSINMNGCAAFIFTTVIYLMQNNNMEIGLVTMLLWVLIATIAAIGNAGIPMGCFFLSTNLLISMNVPIVLIGLILPFYSLLDMIETALNVWSDSCVTKIVDEKTKHIL
jgi:Na+/H+-dicarboxylate symporter